MNKFQLLTWAVVLLLITNAATIATILYHNNQEDQAIDKIAINSGTGVNMLNGRFFRHTLGFKDEQMAEFRMANQAFRPYALDLTNEVDSLKNEMFIIMQNAVPDTVKLNALSAKIGELHGKLKYETYHFYLTLKKICDPTQVAELEKVFQPLFKNESFTSPPDMPRRRGWKETK